MEAAEVDEVIALLIEADAIDDASFARRYAEDKRQLAGWGPDRISAAGTGRGVAPEQKQGAQGGEGVVGQLNRAGGRLRDRGMGCGSERERERALGLLVRRGYPLELAYEAVRRVERFADAA